MEPPLDPPMLITQISTSRPAILMLSPDLFFAKPIRAKDRLKMLPYLEIQCSLHAQELCYRPSGLMHK